MNYLAAKSILYVLVVVLFSSLVSCERLTLDEEPHATSGTPTAGYPNIRDLINGALDEALVAVSNAAARQEERGGTTTGSATVGRIGRSTLVMDPDSVTDEKHFNHEMGHVFGLLHEHQRYDRDDSVRVRRSGSDYNKISRLRTRSYFGRGTTRIRETSLRHTTITQ